MADPQAEAIRQHFGGDRALYEAFRSGCLSRFAEDRRQGQQAVERRDAVGLRHLAHSLKSVLAMLGAAQASQLARALETACEGGPVDEAAWAAITRDWTQLAQGLAGMD